jgi:hypothetical protein
MSRRASRARLATISAVISAVVVGGVAFAAAPNPADVIEACAGNGSGLLRLDDGRGCRKNETPLSWNAQGPAGPQGIPGPAGPPGPGSATYRYRSHQENGGTAARVFCLPGEKVTGGGAFAIGGNSLTQNHPISDPTGVIAHGTTAIGWQAAASNWGAVQVHVICAS